MSEATNVRDFIGVVDYHEKPCESAKTHSSCNGIDDGVSKPLFRVDRHSMKHKI